MDKMDAKPSPSPKSEPQAMVEGSAEEESLESPKQEAAAESDKTPEAV